MTMTSALSALFVVATIIYFAFFDRIFYIKNIFNVGIMFSAPLPYIAMTAAFIYLYARLNDKKIKNTIYHVIASAVFLSLFYLLIDMKLGMIKANPFGGNRGIFGVYAALYYAVAAPALLFLTMFTFGVPFGKIRALLNEAGRRIPKFLKDERFFLLALFVIAVAIRYFWGLRVLGITGSNFIIASDDGPSYDKFAAILSGGGRIPKEEALHVSGFGYWYFLAAIYKLFGPHNFKAMILIQSVLGAAVPVIVYRIGKTIFNNRAISSLAGMLTALDMNLIFLSTVIGMEAIYIPIALSAIWITVRVFACIGTIKRKDALFLGCLFGLAQIIRPELLIFPLVLAILIYVFAKNKIKVKAISAIAISLFTGFLILVSVQGFINYFNYGVYYIVPSSGLKALFIGEVSGGSYINENKILDAMGFNPFRDMGASLSVFLDKPFEVVRLIATGFFRKVIIFFFRPNFGTFDPMYLVNPGSGYVFRFPLFMQLYGFLFTLFGLFAAFIKKDNIPSKTVLVFFVILIASQYSLTRILNARYRGVVIPVIALFLAYGISIFWEKVIKAIRVNRGI